MQEQLFYVWRSFHFDKNVETLDSYTTYIRQVATLLGYGEPQILVSILKHTSYKIILGPISYRRVQAGG